MTKQEIEKAVSDYSKSLEPMAFENLKGEETPYLLRGAYKEGIEFANNHWQEKTRWKSLEKEPPELPEPFEEPLVVRGGISGDYAIKLDYDIKLLVSQNSIDYWLREGFTHWKEIE